MRTPTRNRNRLGAWLLILGGARIGAAEEIVGVAATSEMVISEVHPNRMQLTSAIFPRPNTETEVYRLNVDPGGFPPRVSLSASMTIDNSGAVLAYPAFPDTVANVTALAEDPGTGDLLVLGMTGPWVPTDLPLGDPSYLELFGAGAGVFTGATVARIPNDNGGPVVAALADCNDLALPIAASYLPIRYEVGDVNCDGGVNFADIDGFVLAITSLEEYQQLFPNCNAVLADINQDGNVNNADIDPFVALLTAS